MPPSLRSIATGLIGGALATVAMTGSMVIFERGGLLERQPPEEITGRALAAVGLSDDVDPPTQHSFAAVLHLAFGMAAGGVYAAWADELPVPSVVSGMGWGLVVWGTSYLGWLPALGLQPSPGQDVARHPAMLVAHLVYGAALGTTVEGLRRDRRPAETQR